VKKLKVIILVAIILFSSRDIFPGRLFAADINAVIREFNGDVEVKAPGGDWVPALAGAPLENSTLVSTGFKSTALLAIGNSTILVRPLTRLSLEELAARDGNEDFKLILRAGRVHSEVTPPSSGKVNFTIRNPTATASVRGTSFDFDAISLTVYAGTVVFTGRDNAAIITPSGKSTVIDKQGRASAPASAEERRMAQVSAGAAAVVSAPAAAGPVSPVVAGPGGVLNVPGVIGGPGGGAPQGDAIIDAAW
jgi:hypothetical protein